jgi:Putative Ig domain
MSFQRRFAHSMFAAFAAVLPPAVALLPSFATAAPFTAGNLVVHRVGSGAGALAATGNPVFLDEYTTAGALVQTIAMPTTTVGANRRIISVGTATSEGWLTRSANLNCLLLTGYDAAIPTAGLGASASATVNRVVAVVDASGAIDSTTALSDYATGANPRSAASADCNGIWVGGGAGFVRYATKGTVGVSTQLNNAAGAADNVRQVQVRNGQLYASTAAGTARLYTIGNGLPTTAGQLATALPGIPANSQINSFFFADLSTTVAGLDTLYVADEAGGVNGGLRKYSLVAGTWVSNGVIGTGADFYRGLTGVVSGTTVTLYATRAGGNVAASGGELVSLVDSSGYNVTIAGAPTVLATAGANTTFHGVAFAPIPTPTIVVAPATLPNGTFNAAYSQTITASGGTAPYAFAVTAGSLPAGLTLSAAGVLSGTPTAAGSSSFTVTATDANNFLGTQNYTLVINQLAQAITGFAPTTPVTFGVAPITLTAAGGASGNPVTFATTSAATICTVSGSTLTITGAGTCVVTADQAGNGNYAAALQISASVVVNQASQAITGFAPTSPVTFGAAPINLTATGGASGNPIVFATTSAATVCTVSGATLTITGAGTCALTANQAGNANYTAAPQVTAGVVINPASQVITFAGPASRAFDSGPFAITASGGASGNPVTFTSLTPATCSVAGNAVTLLGVGTCTLRASQAASGNYSAAANVDQSFTINQASQTITGFAPISPIVYSPAGTFALSANGGASGNPVVFASTAPAVCTVSGSITTIVAAGTCTLTANQAGNANFSASQQVTASVTITPSAQTVTFGPLGNVLTGAAPFPLSATASSGLPVTFASTTPSVCTVSGNIVTIIAAGTCTISASQVGAANYAAAPTISQSFSVGGGFSLSSSAGSQARYGEIITLTATVVGTSPRGTVEFGIQGGSRAGQIPACRAVPVVNGVATCIVPSSYQTTQPLAFAASYSGDGTNSPAGTNYLQTVALDTAVLTATIEQSPPVPVGTPFTVTALIRMRNAAGTITFYDGTTSTPVPLKGCEARPVALLADSTDAAIATCTQVSTAAAMPVIVTYTYPANHVSGRIFEQIVQRYQPLSPAPTDYTDIWWRGIGENGWGLSTAQHGATQFNVLYTYDNNGKATWYAMSGGSWNANFTSYTGPLYQPSGSPFSAYDARRFQVGAPVGSMTISYTSPSIATLNYTINGVSGSKPIERQVYAAPDGRTRLKVNDLWWNGFAENGWGMNISQQGSFLFPTWYTYDETGKPNFYVISGGAWNSVAYTGDLYTATSSLWLGVPYNPAQFKPVLVGRMTLDFANGSEGTMTYTVNGVEQTKRISRTEF